MDDSEKRAIAALWSLSGVGIKTLECIRAVFADLGALLERPISLWAPAVRLNKRAQQSLTQCECLAPVADALEDTIQKLGYRIIFPDDLQWPPALRGLTGVPPLFFILGAGALTAPQKRVAIVGTRNPETGATAEVRQLAEEIARSGVGIISGAAEGIDRAAHLGALDAGGETWAFIASAIEQMGTAQRVLRKPFLNGQGTFFSQFAPGARSQPGTFVQRNTWISGSADAVIIARAPRKSGALITAGTAKRQGKPLLAMPGDPWNTAAMGSNTLLRHGARPCLSANDVFATLGMERTVHHPPNPNCTLHEPLSCTAQKVLAALPQVATSFEEILVNATPLSPSETLAALLELEICGQVLQKAGRRYERVR